MQANPPTCPASAAGTASVIATAPEAARKPLTRKDLVAEHPTWCPGCGDFSILAMYYKLLERRQVPQETCASISGIGCSSRFPYFVQAHGAHFIHGRSLPFASGISLTRPDLHVFVFGGDGDLLSIGGNHALHTARKNIQMTCIVMNNSVYGLTKKQTSPTSPQGYKSKTDNWGAVDQPLNPVKFFIAAGATFVARASSTNPNHLLEIMDAAVNHRGFSVIECLSECVEFFPGAFDAANPRKGGVYQTVPTGHDATDEAAAYKLADAAFPGYFGIFFQVRRPTKNELESRLNAKAMEQFQGRRPWQILQASFDRMK